MTLAAPSRRGFLGSLITAFAAPAIIRIAPLMPIRVVPPVAIPPLVPPSLALLNPNTETVSWMGGIFQVPVEAILRDPGLFQKLCTLYGDTSGRRIRPGQRPVFDTDFTLNERETAKRAILSLPSGFDLRGRNIAEENRYAQSKIQRMKAET